MRKAVLLATLLLAAPALAIPTPTTSFKASLPGTTLAKEPQLGGTVVSDKLIPFTIGGTKPATGTVQVRVVRAADATLSFYWKINNAATSTASIQRFFLRGFPGVAYDANWRADGLGTVAPEAVTGGKPNATIPWTMTFDFIGAPIKPGESSRFFFLKSKATATTDTLATVDLLGANTFSAPFKVPSPAN